MSICHRYTNEAVCPHCGNEHTHSHEWFSNGKDTASAECEKCGKPFEIWREFSVEYTTEKPKATT